MWISWDRIIGDVWHSWKKNYMEIKIREKKYWGCDKNEEIKVNKQGFVSAKKLYFCNEIFVTYTNFVSSWYIKWLIHLWLHVFHINLHMGLILKTDMKQKEKKYLLGKLIFFIGYEEKNIMPELIFLGKWINEWSSTDWTNSANSVYKVNWVWRLICNELLYFFSLQELHEFLKKFCACVIKLW